MTKEEEIKLSPMEEGILRALSAVDKQIAREMQRTPAELEVHGVQKWEPYQKRVEFITSFVLNLLGDEKVQLDSLFVFSQAFVKALALVVEDLGEEGLGKLRSEYAQAAIENISKDCFKTDQAFKNATEFT